MIKLDKKSFLYTSENTQTSTQVTELSIIYSNILTFVDNLPVGIIESYCINEGNNILSNSQDNSLFTGDILNELTNQYIAILQALNPSITFTNTL